MTLVGFKKSKRFTKKSKKATPKSKAWNAASRYGRLRDAIDYCKENRIDLRQFNRPEDIVVKCCTCRKILPWIKMDCGHWIGRGLGGSSGVYFDERNWDAQCKTCNGFGSEQQKKHEQYIREKRGQKVIDELELKHHITPNFSYFAMMAMEQMYKEKYNQLLVENGF